MKHQVDAVVLIHVAMPIIVPDLGMPVIDIPAMSIWAEFREPHEAFHGAAWRAAAFGAGHLFPEHGWFTPSRLDSM